jgi:hypothetical protein
MQISKRAEAEEQRSESREEGQKRRSRSKETEK